MNEGKIEYQGKPVKQKIVYTGPIDELFKYKYGHLPYRSLEFRFETFEECSYQDAPITAYPEVSGYTRITEFNKMPVQNTSKTTVAFEYPLPASEKNEPYYPILTEESKTLYEKYKIETFKIQNMIVAGRLGEFKYYNMDQAIKRALGLSIGFFHNEY